MKKLKRRVLNLLHLAAVGLGALLVISFWAVKIIITVACFAAVAFAVIFLWTFSWPTAVLAMFIVLSLVAVGLGMAVEA